MSTDLAVEMDVVQAHVAELGLKMKPVKVEFSGQGKNRKFFVYFTAKKRVEFLPLSRRLFKRHRCRIELKWISNRQHATMLGEGINTCPNSKIPCFRPWCQTSGFGGCFYDKESICSDKRKKDHAAKKRRPATTSKKSKGERK